MIDMERSVVIDLLPDRAADTFTQWLKEHPGIEIISRNLGSLCQCMRGLHGSVAHEGNEADQHNGGATALGADV